VGTVYCRDDGLGDARVSPISLAPGHSNGQFLGATNEI
jgi:hypothetical protein